MNDGTRVLHTGQDETGTVVVEPNDHLGRGWTRVLLDGHNASTIVKTHRLTPITDYVHPRTYSISETDLASLLFIARLSADAQPNFIQRNARHAEIDAISVRTKGLG